jgi:hypothetical protein
MKRSKSMGVQEIKDTIRIKEYGMAVYGTAILLFFVVLIASAWG